MTSRLLSSVIIAGLALGLAGCGDAFNAGPLSYVENERLGLDLKGRPKLQEKVRAGLATLYGRDPQDIHVPGGLGPPLRRHLPGELRRGRGERGEEHKRIQSRESRPLGQAGHQVHQAGGYALYRMHCLHCHGVSGAGDGPTAPFLYPRPRDYRKGLFKFTSTPDRREADPRRTSARRSSTACTAPRCPRSSR